MDQGLCPAHRQQRLEEILLPGQGVNRQRPLLDRLGHSVPVVAAQKKEFPVLGDPHRGGRYRPPLGQVDDQVRQLKNVAYFPELLVGAVVEGAQLSVEVAQGDPTPPGSSGRTGA